MTLNPSKIISLQELKDAKEDAKDLGDALNKKQVIIPRYGNPFNSLPLELDNLAKAIQIALAAGAGAAGWTDSLIQTWSGRTQESKNKESISIYDFDGSANGVQYNDTAFVNAISYLKNQGGGVLRFPHLEQGVYKFAQKTEFTNLSNISIIIDDSVKMDFSAITGTSGQYAWSFKGTLGSEIRLTANATRNDTQITIADTTGIEVGDYLYLMGQRNALHPDAGEEWQLGVPTGYFYDAHACYFAEPLHVISVDHVTKIVKFSKPIIFPNYRVDKTLETSALARECSTVQKLTFAENISINGGEWVGGGGCSLIETYVCKDFDLKVKADMKSNTGSVFQNKLSLATRADIECKHSNTYYITVDHSNYNTIKDMSSWWANINLSESYGVQGIDCTYIVNGGCTLFPTIKVRNYDQHEQGLTFHAGCYGWIVEDAQVYRAKQCALQLRSRYGHIKSVTAIGRNVNASLSAIQFSQWATDIQMSNFYIEGYNVGISTGDLNTIAEPITKNLNITNGTIVRPDIGVRLYSRGVTSDDTANISSLPSGIEISNVKIIKPKTHGVLVGRYVNNVQLNKVKFDVIKNGVFGVYVDTNSVGHNIDISADVVESGGVLFRDIALSDRSTFTESEYPSSRIKLKHSVAKSAGTYYIFNSLSFYGGISQNYTVDAKDDGLSYRVLSPTPVTIMLPTSGNKVYQGTEVTFYNLGDGVVNFITDDVSTVLTGISSLAKNQIITIRKLNTTNPIVWAKV